MPRLLQVSTGHADHASFAGPGYGPCNQGTAVHTAGPVRPCASLQASGVLRCEGGLPQVRAGIDPKDRVRLRDIWGLVGNSDARLLARLRFKGKFTPEIDVRSRAGYEARLLEAERRGPDAARILKTRGTRLSRERATLFRCAESSDSCWVQVQPAALSLRTQ